METSRQFDIEIPVPLWQRCVAVAFIHNNSKLYITMLSCTEKKLQHLDCIYLKCLKRGRDQLNCCNFFLCVADLDHKIFVNVEWRHCDVSTKLQENHGWNGNITISPFAGNCILQCQNQRVSITKLGEQGS